MVKMVVIKFISFLFLIQVIHSKEEEFKVITKLPLNPLMKYNSYASVMILHFYIPLDTTEASFKFKARDDPTSIFVSSCDPRNVSIYMKSGSFPVINPDGVPFPKTFVNISRPKLECLVLKTDLKVEHINLTSPTPGDWFAAAFISWSDPNKDKIHQQGLTSECEANLYAELSVTKENNINTLSLNVPTDVQLDQVTDKIYKFYVSEDVDHVLITINLTTPCKSCEYINIYVQTGSVPNQKKYQDLLVLNGTNEGKDYIWFWPEEENWHYINITFDENTKNMTVKNYAQLTVNLKYISGIQEEFYDSGTNLKSRYFKTSINKRLTIKNKTLQYSIPYKQYNLMRVASSENNFLFEFDFRPNKNGSTPLFLNITSYEMTVLKFRIHEIVDIGGTLTIGLTMKPDLKSKLSKMGNITIVSCIRVDAKEIPTYPNKCAFNNTETLAPIVFNSSTAGSLEYMHLPYPDPGTYFMTIRAFYNECQPCNCSDKCELLFKKCLLDCEYNCVSNCSSCMENCQEKVILMYDCEGCNCDGDCLKFNETDPKNTSVIFSIGSYPCINKKCGSRGKCAHYILGGFLLSTCICSGGYRGWDCSDNSLALKDAEILTAILLLTLSNLLFIPSIYFAYKRGYYTEAVTYFFSMIFSTFYHACDSKENQFGFCLFPLGVLQFCDFYCGLLNIWVTLVAMSYTNSIVISLAHLTGAIILAFSVTYNKHALWVFILPALGGLLLIGINWGLQCRKTKQLFPAKRYLQLYMPIGAGLVFMGLISYAFLETKENYKIIHSLWHVVMALSLIFLLPNKKTFVPKFELD